MLPPRSDNRPDWHILGAGAIGCLYAAHCASGTSLRLLLSQERRRSLVRAGENLKVTGIDGQLHIIPDSWIEASEDEGTIRRLILCTKAHQSRQALADISQRLAPNASVVMLQNGLGIIEEIQAQWPQLELICASTTHGAWRRERNHIVHAGEGETFFDAHCSEVLQRDIRNQLSNEHFQWQAVDDMPTRLWQKLAINCAINALTALLQCRNGELMKHSIGQQQAAICQEVHAVACATGIALPSPDKLMARVEEVMRATADNRSSMLQDISAGRDTEIDYLNGFVAMRGEALGIDCPQNRQLWQQLKSLQNKDHRSQ